MERIFDRSGHLLDKRFLTLALMEFWERFAMAGVKSLLVLILVDDVLAGDLSRVAGASVFRWMVDALFGPLPVTGLASQLYGYANALIYLAIPLGGLLGDLLTGRRMMIGIGGVGMLVGLLLMLRETSFLVGLLLFAFGTGILKGNLSAQVGLLFSDESRRRDGYAIYLGFLNAGMICGPLVCGGLAALMGWVYAIGAAAVAVATGLACYAMGMRVRSDTPGEETAARSREPGRRPIAGRWRTTALLMVALVAIYLCYSAYDQLSNMFLLWARAKVALHVGTWQLPVAWFLSLDGLFTLLLIVASQLAFRALERRGIRIDALTQILLGSLLCAAGYLLLALGSAQGSPVPLAWTLAYLLLIDGAIVLIWPSGLSLIAGLAPRRLVGFWTGLFYLHGFFASLWVGLSGAYYGRILTTQFWLLHAAIAGSGALLVLVIGLPLMRKIGARQAITTSA